MYQYMWKIIIKLNNYYIVIYIYTIMYVYVYIYTIMYIYIQLCWYIQLCVYNIHTYVSSNHIVPMSIIVYIYIQLYTYILCISIEYMNVCDINWYHTAPWCFHRGTARPAAAAPCPPPQRRAGSRGCPHWDLRMVQGLRKKCFVMFSWGNHGKVW